MGSCTGGFENGRANVGKDVVRVYTCNGLVAHLNATNGAAASWNTIALTSDGRRFLTFNGPASDYRTYEDQVRLRREWCAKGACGNAATPGTSNHGCGSAGDLPEGGARTVVARTQWWDIGGGCSDAAWEDWHATYCGGFKRPDPGPNPDFPVLREGSGGWAQDDVVKRAQALLNKWFSAHDMPQHKVDVDGSFGEGTKVAVKRFQDNRDLGSDGVLGEKTWRALR